MPKAIFRSRNRQNVVSRLVQRHTLSAFISGDASPRELILCGSPSRPCTSDSPATWALRVFSLRVGSGARIHVRAGVSSRYPCFPLLPPEHFFWFSCSRRFCPRQIILVYAGYNVWTIYLS